MQDITINPSKLVQFNLTQRQEVNFYLITNSSIADKFRFDNDNSYASCNILRYDGGSFKETLYKTQEPAHILVVSPERYVEVEAGLDVGQRMVITMPSNSTPISLSEIAHFLSLLEIDNIEEQEAFADRLFEVGPNSQYLRIVDPKYGTEAVFDHLDESYEWHDQSGFLDWGGQQLAPAGEVSVFPLQHGEYSTELNLAINGQIAFRGLPILHSGKVNFLRSDQYRLYESLNTMREHAIIATVKDGNVTALECTHPDAELAKQTLEAMFWCDSRYRKIWELGFGINMSLTMVPGNVAMNETYGGENGVVHFGLGLTPYTQYHLDIMCPHSLILTDNDEVFLGSSNVVIRELEEPSALEAGVSPSRLMSRTKAAGCPCL
ncbi:MAG: hypothetical protein QNJ63_12235 [Calothrix sp. MO_192.B10]|nr:hypothetical protein [Calothrix sp. MO_192.B10]